MTKSSLMLLSLLALGACNESDEEGDAKSGDAKSGDAESDDAKESAKLVPIQIEKFGLTIDAPEGAEAKEMMDDIRVKSGQDLDIFVGEAGKFDAPTLEERVKEATESTKGENLKEETLDNGWALTFTNSGKLGSNEVTNYWVDVRLTFGDKTYHCNTTASTEDQQAAALAACKSLRQE